MRVTHFLSLVIFLAMTHSHGAQNRDQLQPSQLYQPFKVTTYNVGLAYTFVPYSMERRPHLISQISKLDSDVLCLQEVWTGEDQQMFTDELKKSYPYSHQLPPRQKFTQNKPACYPWDLFGPKKLGNCLLTQCLSKKGDEFTSCVIHTCQQEMRDLKNKKPECAGALFAQVGKSMTKGLTHILNPFRSVPLFAYEGSPGILLFSKFPINKKDTLDFFEQSTSNRRAALYTEIEVSPQTKVHLTCTHLSANLTETVPYTGHFTSWEEENKFQIEKILDWMDEKDKVNIQMVVGDINCSLEHPGTLESKIEGDFQQNCEIFQQRNYWSALIQTAPQCSFCSSNTLNSPEESKKKNYLIDHVWVKNAPFSSLQSAKIIFNQTFMIDQKLLHLSDHFGLQAEFLFPVVE